MHPSTCSILKVILLKPLPVCARILTSLTLVYLTVKDNFTRKLRGYIVQVHKSKAKQKLLHNTKQHPHHHHIRHPPPLPLNSFSSNNVDDYWKPLEIWVISIKPPHIHFSRLLFKISLFHFGYLLIRIYVF